MNAHNAHEVEHLRERVRTLEAALGLRNDPIQLIQVTFKLSPTLANT